MISSSIMINITISLIIVIIIIVIMCFLVEPNNWSVSLQGAVGSPPGGGSGGFPVPYVYRR